jgi:predicted metal-dependent peptidase
VSSEPGGPFAALEEAAARQAAEEQAARALAGARARLILGRDAKSVFFATLALRLTAEPAWDLDTLATDGRALRYHPSFVNALSPDVLVGVLAHEVLHNALAHPMRQGGREFGTWNVACDLAINPLLLQAGIILPADRLVPGEGTYTHLEPGKSAEEYYALLAAASGPPDDTLGDADRGAADPGRCGGVESPAQSRAENRQAEAEWRVAVAQAERAAAGRGPLPAGLRRSVAEVLCPPADWRAVLREFVAATARNDYSWARPNRRFLAHGLYLPGLRSEELGPVVLAVDTSGSISEASLGVFAAEANAVLAAYDGVAVTVVYHDTAVQRVQSWTSADGPLVLDPVGGGGTSHVCVFDWLAASGLDPVCLIALTDLETEFPPAAPAVPVLWAVVGNPPTVPPFGRVVSLSP